MPYSSTPGDDNLGLVGIKLHCKNIRTFAEMGTNEHTFNDDGITWGGELKQYFYIISE